MAFPKTRTLYLAALASVAMSSLASAQCGYYWDTSWGPAGIINTTANYDDGTGMAFYVGGQFTAINFGPSRVDAVSIAKRGPNGWEALPENLGTPLGLQPAWIQDMEVFQGELYAGGLIYQVYTGPGNPNINPDKTFNDIARWNGQHWNDLGGGVTTVAFPVGAGPRIYCLHVHDDGTGPQLYVGGEFEYAGAEWSPQLARWDGEGWNTINPFNSPFRRVTAMATFDEDGTGPNPPHLFVGGIFDDFNGIPAKGLVRWDGEAWSAVPGWPLGLAGSGANVSALQVYDPDGAGPAPAKLFVGGGFSTDPTGNELGNHNIAAWDGSTWTTPVTLPNVPSSANVVAMAVAHEGTQPVLYMGTELWTFQGWQGVNEGQPYSLLRFDGTTTSTLGGGAYIPDPYLDDPEYEMPPMLFDCYTMAEVQTDRGPALYIAGNFYQLDGGNVQALRQVLWAPRANPADFNNSGQVTVQDIFDFLSAWFAGTPNADFNGAGGVTVQDIFDFLAAWFAGGC